MNKWMEKGHRSGESILKFYMLHPEKFVGVDRKTNLDLKQKTSETKKPVNETDLQIPDVEISKDKCAGDGPSPADVKESAGDKGTESTHHLQTAGDEEIGSTNRVQSHEDDKNDLGHVAGTDGDEEIGSKNHVPSHEDDKSDSSHVAGTDRDEEIGSKNHVQSHEDDKNDSSHAAESTENAETDTTRIVETAEQKVNSSTDLAEKIEEQESDSTYLVESSSSGNSSETLNPDSTSTDTSLTGFNSGISARLKDFSSGPTTPRARGRKSRRNAASHKLKRIGPLASPTCRQKCQIYETYKRFQNISRLYVPQRHTNLYSADFKASQKKLANERVRGADSAKNGSKSLKTSPEREKSSSGQPYTLFSKKNVQQATNRTSKTRGRTKNLVTSKGITAQKNKSVADVYSSVPPPRTVVRFKH